MLDNANFESSFSEGGHFPNSIAGIVLSEWPASNYSSSRHSHIRGVNDFFPLRNRLTTVTSHDMPLEVSDEVLFEGNQTATVAPALRANWLELSRSGLSNEAFERLGKLADKPSGWRGPNSRALSAASLAKFLTFWVELRDVAAEPELMLTPRGTIQAEWYRSHLQFLEIEFDDRRRIGNFGLIDGRTRLEGGAMGLNEISQTIRTYRKGVALKWSSRSGV